MNCSVAKRQVHVKQNLTFFDAVFARKVVPFWVLTFFFSTHGTFTFKNHLGKTHNHRSRGDTPWRAQTNTLGHTHNGSFPGPIVRKAAN